MRAFVVLSLIAVASAGRLGYNYQPGHSGSVVSGISGNGIGSGIGGVSGIGGGSLIASGSGIGGGSSIGLGPGFGSGSLGLSGGGSIGTSGHGGEHVIDGGVSKEYYTYSAPEENVSGDSSQNAVTTVRRNIRVLFIRAPENNAIKNTVLNLAKQVSEDRTAIYVLTKEPDASELAHQVQDIQQSVRHKPEVHFVKYKTPQDAIQAQQAIQAQYDSLGGSTHSSNEGVAPVLNFASESNVVRVPSGSSNIGSIGGGNLGGGSIGVGGNLGDGSLGGGSLGSVSIGGGSLGGGSHGGSNIVSDVSSGSGGSIGDLSSGSATSIVTGGSIDRGEYLPPIVY